MKKILFLSFVLSLVFVGNAKAAESLNEKLSGRIVVAVEKNGEAYWINPTDKLAYYLGRPQDAFNLMKSKGLGISEKDFNQFISYGPPKSLAGKIILRVQSHGEAYYVNPLNLEFNYLGDPKLAFRVMRNLGLGINNTNLNKILGNNKTNNGTDETANWKTYQYRHPSAIYGFELKLPEVWTAYTTDANTIYLRPEGANDHSIAIRIYDKSVSETEKVLPVLNIPGYDYPAREITSRTNEIMNNISWTKLIVGDNQAILLTFSRDTDNGGHTYEVQYATFNETSAKIAATFKFLK